MTLNTSLSCDDLMPHPPTFSVLSICVSHSPIKLPMAIIPLEAPLIPLTTYCRVSCVAKRGWSGCATNWARMLLTRFAFSQFGLVSFFALFFLFFVTSCLLYLEVPTPTPFILFSICPLYLSLALLSVCSPVCICAVYEGRYYCIVASLITN